MGKMLQPSNFNMMRRCMVFVLLFSAVFYCVPANAATRLKIVASFSILADFASQIGGDSVEVSSLIPPLANPHQYQATPADAKSMQRADLVLVNGLGFDSFAQRLAKSTHAQTKILEVGTAVTPQYRQIDGQRVLDPHIWQDPKLAIAMVQAISKAMIAADPQGKNDYEKNTLKFVAEIARLDRELQSKFSAIPETRRKIVTSHDAFGYFGAAMGIAFLAPESLSPHESSSAKKLSELIAFIRREKITTIFVETISNPRLIKQIAAETGAKLGLPLYSDSLSEKSGVAATYLKMMQYNSTQFLRAMQP